MLRIMLLLWGMALGLVASVPALAGVTYYHTNHLGSVVARSNASGAVVARQDYRPYGGPGGSSLADVDPGYTGHLYDKSLKLNYMKARFYDPQIGRFYSADPVGFQSNNPISFNRYAYANNNPYKYVDPTGEYGVLAVIAAGYVVFEFGSSVYDYYDFGRTLLNPDSTATDIALSGIGVAAGILLPGPGSGYAHGLESLAGTASSGTTMLYRAVGPDELLDIRNTGQLINRGSAEGKYFTSSLQNASNYAKQAVNAFGDLPYTTIKTQVPNSSLPVPVSVDGGIPAFVLPDVTLSGLKPEILNSMELP